MPNTMPGPDLASYDHIVISLSGGKDSQATLDHTVTAARAAGVAHRITAVHADLGRAEWPGTAALAAEHAAFYGLRFETVARRGPDLLARIEERGRFPDAARRWCTSDFKRGPIRRLFTALAAESRAAGITGRPVRLLSVMGQRAEESPARRRLTPFTHDGSRTCPCPQCHHHRAQGISPGHGASNTRKHVDTWLPAHHWTTADVWRRIAAAGTRPHPAYAAGMPRLSCIFCVLASKPALIRAAQLAPELAAEYAGVEHRIGHRFRLDLSMAEVITAAANTPLPSHIDSWAA
ncbi:phosphoadenosine phosphosulfate reductase family protein [Nocardia amamiensis]|uniref:phosphoadenosine phosphosulfate reductase family protein n=1 Tax=Nocardia amamiensis TaxID=404578 RepID=UPI000836ED63|nr:phosphoadenosine phosphosulfate reductase family protein [Nocardia amamiensis]